MRPAAKTVAARKARVESIWPKLSAAYPEAKCSLDFTTPLELLVATILSAQCTDVRVNMVTKSLFAKYRTAADYANAPNLETDIQSTGFYNAKAKAIRTMAKALIDEHNGEVPNTMEALTALRGVGRKTANVVLGNAFHDANGIAVDTHVTRVANRLGLTKHPSDAVKIEADLMPLLERERWTMLSHLLIYHGRGCCFARSPACERCPIFADCPAGPKILNERAKQ